MVVIIPVGVTCLEYRLRVKGGDDTNGKSCKTCMIRLHSVKIRAF